MFITDSVKKGVKAKSKKSARTYTRDAKGRFASTGTAKKPKEKKVGTKYKKKAPERKTPSKKATARLVGVERKTYGIKQASETRQTKAKSALSGAVKQKPTDATGLATKTTRKKTKDTKPKKPLTVRETVKQEEDKILNKYGAEILTKEKELRTLKNKLATAQKAGIFDNKVAADFVKKETEVNALKIKAQAELNANRQTAIFKAVKSSYSEPSLRNRHGMKDAEDMWSIDVDGIKIHATGEFNDKSPAIKIARELLKGEELPKSLTRHSSDIYITTQKNKNDEYWANQYNIPDFKSAATGGSGDIVIYNNKPISRDTIVHEMGHNLANGRYVDIDPPETSDYGKAIKQDGLNKAVTQYATLNRAEDFAESVSAYFSSDKKLRQALEDSPERFKVIERLIKDENYKG